MYDTTVRLSTFLSVFYNVKSIRSRNSLVQIKRNEILYHFADSLDD